MRGKYILIWLMVVAFVIGSLPICVSAEETVKGTFDGWTWQVTDSVAGAEIDTSDGVKGNASLKLWLKERKTTGYVWIVTDGMPVEKGHQYILEFDAKVKNSNGSVELRYNWTDSVSLLPVANSYDWTRFKLTWTARATESMGLRFVVESETEGLWLDNLNFYDTQNPSVNLVANPDFERNAASVNKVTAPTDDNGGFVVYHKTMTIDGKVDDWAEIEKHPIEGVDKLVECDTVNSGNIRFSADKEKLYILVEAKDPSHHPVDGSLYWQGDSVQFRLLGENNAPSGTEYGIAFIDAENKSYTTSSVVEAVSSREGDVTYYEIALPWSTHFPNGVPDSFPFNLIINNNNGTERDHCLEITPGIVRTKEPSLYKKLYIMSPLGRIMKSVDCLEGSTSAKLTLVNPSEGKETVTVSVPEINYEKQISLSSEESMEVVIPFKLNAGENIFTIKLASGGEESVQTKTLVQYYTSENYLSFNKNLEKFEQELKALILQCQEKGMTPDYEIANYQILCRFIRTIAVEHQHGDYTRMHMYEPILTNLYQETKAKLNAYLKGEETPLSVPRYITGDLKLDGTSVIGMVENNGKREERPVFFTGYGHFQEPQRMIPYMENMGVNVIQSSIHIRHVLQRGEIDDYVPGWTNRKSGDTKGKFVVSDEASASGTHSLKVASTDSSNDKSYRQLFQTVTVKPNTKYEFGCVAKGDKVGIVKIYKDWKQDIGFSLSASDDWKTYKTQYITGEEEESVTLRLVVESDTENLYIDDIYLREVENDKNLVADGNFERVHEINELDKTMAEFGCYVEYGLIDELKATFEKAERENVLVDMGVSIQEMPTYMNELIENSLNQGGYKFLNYRVDNEQTLRFIKAWGEFLAELVRGYSSVHSVMVFNEPALMTNMEGDYYLPAFREYLKEQHGTVERLNQRYGTEYTDFEQVSIPKIMESTPQFYDYIQFNDAMLTQHAEWLVESMRKVNPDVWYHIKVMQYANSSAHGWLQNGTDFYSISRYCDLNGTDSNSSYRVRNATDLPLWLDYMTSIKNAPVWDTEVHIASDASSIVNKGLFTDYVAGSIWNGAIHGRGTAIFWVWDLDDFAPWGSGSLSPVNTNFALRPLEAAANAKAMLDVQRLSREIVAVQKAERKVGIVYSRTSQVYTDYYTTLRQAYEDVIESGQKAGFVVDGNIDTMNQYDLLIVPNQTNLTEKMILGIKGYLEAGGKVVILGEDSLKKNEYDQYHNQEMIDAIYAMSDIRTTVKDAISRMGLSKVTLQDAKTGAALEDVEWAYAEYNGKILVNVMNYDEMENKEIQVLYEGKPVESLTELRSNVPVNGSVTAYIYQPILLQFEK